MRCRFISGLVFLIFLLFFSSVLAEKKIFYVGINDQDNFPAMGKPGTENDPNPGILIEGMRFVADFAGLKVKYIRFPWKRCLKVLQAGEMNALICGSYKKEREIFGAFPKTINGKADRSRRFIDSSYFLYVKRNSDLTWDGKRFSRKDIRIGAELGFSIVPKLKMMGVQVEEVNSVRINFIKLLTGRLDGVAAHESSGDVIMLFRPEIVKVEIPLKSRAYYLMISHQIIKREPDLALKIWEVCRKMQEEEMARIKEKYSGKKSWEDM